MYAFEKLNGFYDLNTQSSMSQHHAAKFQTPWFACPYHHTTQGNRWMRWDAPLVWATSFGVSESWSPQILHRLPPGVHTEEIRSRTVNPPSVPNTCAIQMPIVEARNVQTPNTETGIWLAKWFIISCSMYQHWYMMIKSNCKNRKPWSASCLTESSTICRVSCEIFDSSPPIDATKLDYANRHQHWQLINPMIQPHWPRTLVCTRAEATVFLNQTNEDWNICKQPKY